MRTSVIAGIFACTLIFVVNASKAEALEIATEKTSETSTSLVKIETMNEIQKSPLLTMTEEKVETVPVEEKKPVIHTVAENETLSLIAKQYQTTWERVYSKNTQIENPNIVSAGAQLTIPEATEELSPRPMPAPPVNIVVAKKQSVTKSNSVPGSSIQKGNSTGNGYVAGYCTWYVKNRRPDLPNNLGNASTWVSRLAQGFSTGSTPAVGAVGQRNNHVVYVESINGDGTITISDMNYQARYALTTRVVLASDFRYIY